MPLATCNGRNIFFAHVPKTGGSSVEEYLTRRFGKLSLLDHNKRLGVPGTSLMTPVTHLTKLDLSELLPEPLDYCFAVVRDPVARLQSEYRYQTGESRASRFSFSTWLRIMLAAMRIEPRIYENHIRPQDDLVPEEAEIFFLEEGLDVIISRLDTVTGDVAPHIEFQHLLKRQRKPMKLFKQDVEAIEAHYATDYARFGFEPRDRSDLPDDPFSGAREVLGRGMARLIVSKQRSDWLR